MPSAGKRPNGPLSEDHAYFVHVLRDLFPPDRGRSDRRRAPERPVSQGPALLVAESPQERRAAAVGALVLAQVAERGGTNLDSGALLSIAEKALNSFELGDRPALFDEMVGILDWLADNLRRKDRERERDPSLASLGALRRDGRPPRGGRDDVEFDPGPAIDALDQAIADGADVLLDYYSFHRKTWTQRQVTPKSIVGEFLVAHCHMRGDDRRFRLTRIRAVKDAAGPAPKAAALAAADEGMAAPD